MSDWETQMRQLYCLLHAMYSTTAPSSQRLDAWIACIRDVDARLVVRTVDEAPRRWPERMPTLPQFRAAALAGARQQAPQPEPDNGWPADLARWRNEHADTPLNRLSVFLEGHPPGEPLSAEDWEYEAALRREAGWAPRSASLKQQVAAIVGGVTGERRNPED